MEDYTPPHTYTISVSDKPYIKVTVTAPYYFAYGMAKGIAKQEKCSTSITDENGTPCDSFN
jgi:hypothetical protein